MAERCSYIMKTYLLAMFYGPIMPLAYPITFCSLIVEYWVDKFILLRRHSRPLAMGKELNETIQRFIPIGVLLNCASTMLFFTEYDRRNLIPSVIGLVISFAILMTPWQRIIKL